MFRSIRCHLQHLCKRIRLRGFQRRSLESMITFTVAETRQRQSNGSEEHGRSMQSSHGRRKREQLRERSAESTITFRAAEARWQEKSVSWEEQGRGKRPIAGNREAEQTQKRSPESKIVFRVAAGKQKEAFGLEEQYEDTRWRDGRRIMEQVQEEFAGIELQRSRSVTESSSDCEKGGRIRLATFNVALFSLAPAVPSHPIAHQIPAPSSSEPVTQNHLRSESPSQTNLPSSSSTRRSSPASYSRRHKRTNQQTPQAACQLLHPASDLRSAIKGKPPQESSTRFAIRPRARLMQSWSSRMATKRLVQSLRISSRMGRSRISSVRNIKGLGLQIPAGDQSESASTSARAWIKAPSTDHASGCCGSQQASHSCWQAGVRTFVAGPAGGFGETYSVLDVLREADADVVALQEVRAEEGEGMRPLSELAEALGMGYVFAESWAPQFGNAILSRWPIKSCYVQKLPDGSDYGNVLKVVIDVPMAEELHFCCTHLDHLDEDARLKQVVAVMKLKAASSTPHILAGDLNALDPSDYSRSRWDDIAEMQARSGKAAPRGDVMRFLKQKGYTDCKSCGGHGDGVVVLPRGQEIEGTCKSGTRIDYILAAPSLPYRFVRGSYAMVASKGTSHHHLVRVDIKPK